MEKLGDRIKGITIEIGGDTTGLDKALKGTNKNIRDTQGQLKDIERLLKLDPTNTELLRQKQKLLAQAVADTKTKLDTLKQANKQAADSAKNYDAWKAKFDPIQAEILETQKVLDNLKIEQNKLAKAEKFETEEYKKVQEEIKETEKIIKNLKKQAKDVSKEFGNPISTEQYNKLQREIIATEQSLKTMEKQAKHSNATLNKISATSKQISDGAGKLAGATAPLTAGIAAIGAISFKAASDVNESMNKVNVVFDTSAEKVKSFADVSLETYGIAKGTALDMSALFGDMATSMGVSRAEAANMSIKLTGLAGDLASFKNIGLDQAMTALNGVFTGETESLRGIGVVMTQTALQAYAVSSGFVDCSKSALQLEKETLALETAQQNYNEKVKKYGKNSLEARNAMVKVSEAEQKLSEGAKVNIADMTEQEKVMLRYNYVLNQTKNAEGDFANTKNAAANSMKTMTETVKQLSAEFGEQLLPIITPIIQKVTELMKWFSSLDTTQKGMITTILMLVAAISPIAGLISGILTIVPALITGITAVNAVMAANPIGFIILGISTLMLLLTYLWQNCEGFRNFFIGIWQSIMSVLSVVIDFIKNVFATDFTEIFGPFLGTILNNFFMTVKDIFDGIIKIFTGIIDFIQGVFTGNWQQAWQGICNIFLGIWDMIKNGAIACINFIIQGINSLIEFALTPLNLLIEAANVIPGVNIPKLQFAIPKIPYLAKGGTVVSGSAVVGEAGPELLTVSPRGTMVTPFKGNTGLRNLNSGITIQNMSIQGYSHTQGSQLARDLNRELGRLYK